MDNTSGRTRTPHLGHEGSYARTPEAPKHQEPRLPTSQPSPQTPRPARSGRLERWLGTTGDGKVGRTLPGGPPEDLVGDLARRRPRQAKHAPSVERENPLFISYFTTCTAVFSETAGAEARVTWDVREELVLERDGLGADEPVACKPVDEAGPEVLANLRCKGCLRVGLRRHKVIERRRGRRAR